VEIRRDEREEWKERRELAHERVEFWRERGGSWMPGEEELSTVYTVSRTDGLVSDSPGALDANVRYHIQF